MYTQIFNGKILLPGGKWLSEGSVIIKNGKICEVINHSRRFEGITDYIDAKGGYVLPGGIDMHVHGGGGRDFMEASEEAFKTAVMVHRKHGTTSLFPTLASTDNSTMRAACEICSSMMETPENGILGMHLEGPYFNAEMVGGQDPENIRLPSSQEYIALIDDYPCIRRWDSAPELPGAIDFAKYINSKGIIAGLAHTKADYKITLDAYKNGYTLATHFYNAMTAAHKEGIYKHEGTVESIFLIDGFSVEVIADGIHVPPVILAMINKFKGFEGVSLVTDSLALTESPDGSSYDPQVVIENGVCKLKDGSALAGSCATMDRLIKTMVEDAEIPLEDVARMASETPARLMGVYDKKGSISKNKDADLIIMNGDLTLTHVLAMGKSVDI